MRDGVLAIWCLPPAIPLLVLPPSICPWQGEAEVEMGEDTQQDESAVLTIHGATRAHAGVYRCTADNGIGQPGSTDVQLVVQCESMSVFAFSRRLPVNLEQQQIEMAPRKYIQWKHINFGVR